jgi:hypothetical protein
LLLGGCLLLGWSASAAEPDCANKASCITIGTEPATGQTRLKNTCKLGLHCLACPVYAGAIDGGHCGNADLLAGGHAEVVFPTNPERVNLTCRAADSVAACQGVAAGPARAEAPVAAAPREEIDNAQAEEPPPPGEWSDAGRLQLTYEGMGLASYSASPGPVSSTRLGFGGGFRVALTRQSVPNRALQGGSWLGLRLGLGLDVGGLVTQVRDDGSSKGVAPGGSKASPLLELPLFVGWQMSFGDFDSETHWSGVLVGLDYQPRLGLSPGASFVPIAFNLHVAPVSYEPPSDHWGLRPHFDANLWVVPPLLGSALALGVGLGVIWQ